MIKIGEKKLNFNAKIGSRGRTPVFSYGEMIPINEHNQEVIDPHLTTIVPQVKMKPKFTNGSPFKASTREWSEI